jgi:hypothetical protein
LDHIVFYKNGESLKDHFANRKLSYTRNHKYYFATIYDQIGKLLSKIGDEFLLFYFTDTLSENDKTRLQTLRLKYPKIDICLFSNVKEAFLAWKLQVFHFDKFQDTSSVDIQTAYKKYLAKHGGSDREYIIKTNNGIIRLPYDSINCLVAGGNYTTIKLKDDKSVTQTKQLGLYMDFCDKDPNFIRMGRSLILNFKNIKTVGNQNIEFYNCTKTLGISKNLERKLKKELLK